MNLTQEQIWFLNRESLELMAKNYGSIGQIAKATGLPRGILRDRLKEYNLNPNLWQGKNQEVRDTGEKRS